MSLITEVKIENFQNISSAAFAAGKFNQICGKNSQGKTSVNQAIQFAHEGSKDPSLIKTGQEKATVELTYADGAVLTRWLKRREGKPPTTAVKYERDGMTPAKIQTHLNKMIGVGSFDPRELLNPKTRNQSIMEMIDIRITKKQLAAALKGLDVQIPDFNFDENALKVIENAEAYYYAIRTERNKETKESKTRWMTAVTNVPEKPELQMEKMDLADLENAKDLVKAEYLNLKTKVSDWEDKAFDLLESKETLKENDEAENKLISEIESLQKSLNEMHKANKILDDSIGVAEKKLGEKPDVMAETKRITDEGTALADEIQRHKDIESVERQEAAAKSLEEAYLSAAEKSTDLDSAVNRMRTTFKREVMESADLPIKGLEYADGEFNLAGRSLTRLSSSEALIIGLQLTRKKNPNTNVICIDGGECLDAETYANLQRAVADDGFNYFLTKVGPAFDSETDTVIEMSKGEPVQ